MTAVTHLLFGLPGLVPSFAEKTTEDEQRASIIEDEPVLVREPLRLGDTLVGEPREDPVVPSESLPDDRSR